MSNSYNIVTCYILICYIALCSSWSNDFHGSYHTDDEPISSICFANQQSCMIRFNVNVDRMLEKPSIKLRVTEYGKYVPEFVHTMPRDDDPHIIIVHMNVTRSNVYDVELKVNSSTSWVGYGLTSILVNKRGHAYFDDYLIGETQNGICNNGDYSIDQCKRSLTNDDSMMSYIYDILYYLRSYIGW